MRSGFGFGSEWFWMCEWIGFVICTVGFWDSMGWVGAWGLGLGLRGGLCWILGDWGRWFWSFEEWIRTWNGVVMDMSRGASCDISIIKQYVKFDHDDRNQTKYYIYHSNLHYITSVYYI